MRKIEPTGLHQCPEGYEYVNGHEEKGIHVRPYCRKISKKRIKMKFDMRYPGNTTITASVREGFKRESASYNVPTDSLFVDEKGKQLQDIMNEQWMGKEGTLKKQKK